MRRYRLAALLIACVVLFSGCSLVAIDEDRVANQVVATVNGTEIYRYEVEDTVDYYVEYEVQMYAYYYGIEYSDDDIEQLYEQYRQSVLESYVVNEVLRQKAAELGITLTDEEKAEQQTAANEYFESLKEDILAQIEGEWGITDFDEGTDEDEDIITQESLIEEQIEQGYEAYAEKELETRYNETLEEAGYTEESYYENLCDQAVLEKVVEYIYGLAEVTDEDVQDWYDQTLALQQEEMDEDGAAFADYVYNGLIYTYVPEDTIAVKQVYLAFADEDLVEEAKTLYNNGDIELAFELLEPQTAELMGTAQDIQQRLIDGEDIDTLIEEYGEDPGMTEEPHSEVGYLVESRTENYVDEFSEAALGLTSVRDVSDPAVSYMGIHVLQCIKIYEQGVIAYEDIYEDIKEALLPSAEEDKYEEMTEQWLDEAKVVYHIDRLANG